jgi:hypothetical protein
MRTFEELLEPYKENGRTIAGQIAWLRTKKGFAPNIVEQAIQETYIEMDNGKTFIDGNELDQYILAKCKAIREEDYVSSIERMQNRISSLVNPTIEGGKLKKAWLAIRGKI